MVAPRQLGPALGFPALAPPDSAQLGPGVISGLGTKWGALCFAAGLGCWWGSASEPSRMQASCPGLCHPGLGLHLTSSPQGRPRDATASALGSWRGRGAAAWPAGSVTLGGVTPRDLQCPGGHLAQAGHRTGTTLWWLLGRGTNVGKRPLIAPQQHPECLDGYGACLTLTRVGTDSPTPCAKGKVAAELGGMQQGCFGVKSEQLRERACLEAAGETPGEATERVKRNGQQREELGTAHPCSVPRDGKRRRSGATLTCHGRGRETEAGEGKRWWLEGAAVQGGSRIWMRPEWEQHMGDGSVMKTKTEDQL